MQKRWYAIHTYSGHEDKVSRSIKRQAEVRGLWGTRVFDVQYPTEIEIRTRAGKKHEVKKKLFPGYVLVQMMLDEDTWFLVKSTSGVIGFVSPGQDKNNRSKPVPLPDKDVMAMLQQETPAGAAPIRPKVQWNKGDVIRVNSGPFADFTGKIEDVNIEREKLRVFISIFGRETPVELEFTQVERA
jgi:transcriptional antiterminator NusG